MQININKYYNIEIDELDFEKIKDLKLAVILGKKKETYCIYYAKSSDSKKVKKKFLHQLILGEKKSDEVAYFKNGNRLDLRRDNVCYIPRKTFSHIHKNPKLNEGATVGVVKVFTSRIKYNGKILHLGTFNTPEEAALAYNKKALELFGYDKAIINNNL
jgi:hypothetical protein